MFRDVYRGKRVLVTGNTGFKGSWLTMWLSELGADIYGLSNGVPTNPSLFEAARLSTKCAHFEGDIRDFPFVEKVVNLTRPDFVFHLAAQPLVIKSFSDPKLTFETNTVGTLNVLESLRRVNANCTAVLITSDKCYRNVEWTWGYRENDQLGGDDPYSASKGAAELVIHSYATSYFRHSYSNVRVCSARAGNVIGGGDWADNRIVPDAIRAWSKGETLRVRNASSTRPWQHVLEPLSGYLQLAVRLADDRSLNAESFNFGPDSRQNHTVERLLVEMSSHFPGARWESEAVLTEHEAGLLKLCCDKSLHVLQWEPNLVFRQTVDLVMQWYNRYVSGSDDMYSFSLEQIRQYETEATKKGLTWTT